MMQAVIVACIGLVGVLIGQGITFNQNRRQARAELLGAQRSLAKARRQNVGLEELEDAASDVARLGLVAGVPRWLTQRYQGVVIAEAKVRRTTRPEVLEAARGIGEIELISRLSLVGDELRMLGEMADERRWTEAVFTEAVWWPWRSKWKARQWKKVAEAHQHHRAFIGWGE